MSDVRLRRDGEADVLLPDAIIVGQATSARPDCDRWWSVVLYEYGAHGRCKFAVSVYGGSHVAGESPRYQVFTFASADALLDYQPKKNPRMLRTLWFAALRQAGYLPDDIA